MSPLVSIELSCSFTRFLFNAIVQATIGISYGCPMVEVRRGGVLADLLLAYNVCKRGKVQSASKFGTNEVLVS